MAGKTKGKKGKGTTTDVSNVSILKREVIVQEYLRTGSTLLDMALSCHKDKFGGIPTRRISEFSGTGASGKTFICGEIAGDALRKTYDVYVDDIERRWDLTRLSTFGIKHDCKRFHYMEGSKSVEGCFERMFRILDKKKDREKTLFIIDPIAALYALQELKSDKMSQARAKALQKHFRILKDYVSYSAGVTNCVIFSNQLIDDPTAGLFAPKQKTPGGNAIVHWPTTRVRFDFRGKIVDEIKRPGEKGKKDDEEAETKSGKKKEKLKIVRGINLHAEVTKNSEDDPFRGCNFSIHYGYGIDDIRDCSKWLKEHTEILGLGKHLKIPKRKKDKKEWPSIAGIANFVRFVEDNNLEKWLFKLTRRHYRKWYEPKLRKPKVR